MKKIVLKVLSIALVVVMLFSMASCNNDNNHGNSTTPPKDPAVVKEETGVKRFSTKDYSTYISFYEDLLEYYTGSTEQKEAIKNNESVKTKVLDWDSLLFDLNYIHRAGVSWDTIHELLLLFYSESDLEVLPVNVDGMKWYVPFTYIMIHDDLLEKIRKDVRFEFKNPESVKIYSATVYVAPGTTSYTTDDGKYPSSFTLYAKVKCSGQNGFGGTIQSDIYTVFNGQKFVGVKDNLWDFVLYLDARNIDTNNFLYLETVECE